MANDDAEDLEAAREIVQQNDINAVYPDPVGFAAELDAATITARQEATSVSDFAGYRATLKHFLNSLDDEYVGISFAISQPRLFWPGFVIEYVGNHYIVAASTRLDVHNGQSITACDGTPMDTWVDRVSTYEGGHHGLESTKSLTAPLVLVDQANPFLTRPAVCTIDGKSFTLDWKRIFYEDYLSRVSPLLGEVDKSLSITALSRDVAWVRLGNFAPATPSEAAAFREVLAKAASVRDKAVIILDVRQNRGGPYDWMVAFLRSLYGQQYADHFATARLTIRPVYRASPEIVRLYRASDESNVALGSPSDKQADGDGTRGVADALAHGLPYYQAPLAREQHSDLPAINPVRAKVFVLTDYGCASVCIGFVDELKRFPGVKQIGTETFVDSRSGTPLTLPLPSGDASVYVPTMTRDGRLRDDNVPQRPDILFKGDIHDDSAVKQWILVTLIQATTRR